MNRDIPLVPKNPDGDLRVIVIGRLSQPKDTKDETEKTIESSYKYVEDFLRGIYQGPLCIRHLGEQISGMVADRATILEAMELIESGEWDLVIVEDLSRVYRNPRLMYVFVQDCVDADIRFIAIADHLDTSDENWEIMLGAATFRHGTVIPDTRRRQKRKAKYSFHKGGMVTKVRFGYRKLTKEEAASGQFGPKDLRETKVPECTPVYTEMRRRLMETKSPAAVLDYLVTEQIPPGPYVKSGRWSPGVLKGALCDPKLHGSRVFRRKTYDRVLKTGKYRIKNNPTPEIQHVPQLAHMTREEQESMLAAVGWEIDWGNPKVHRPSPRKNVSRRRSNWPGQAGTCAICKGSMVIFGDHLRCSKSLKECGDDECWNHVEVPLDLTRRTVLSWLIDRINETPLARDTMVDAAWKVLQVRRAKSGSAQENRSKEIRSLETQQQNLAKAIGLGGRLEALVAEIARVEKRLGELRNENDATETSEEQFTPYTTREEVNAGIDKVLELLIGTSFDFADVMRRFFPVFVIQPVQALDCTQVHPRGKLRFGPISDAGDTNGASHVVEVSFDLFEPPDPVALMPKIVAARRRDPRPTYRQIAAELGTNYMTVKRGLAYARLMEELGTSDPFRELHEMPAQAGRWRIGNKRRRRAS